MLTGYVQAGNGVTVLMSSSSSSCLFSFLGTITMYASNDFFSFFKAFIVPFFSFLPSIYWQLANSDALSPPSGMEWYFVKSLCPTGTVIVNQDTMSERTDKVDPVSVPPS